MELKGNEEDILSTVIIDERETRESFIYSNCVHIILGWWQMVFLSNWYINLLFLSFNNIRPLLLEIQPVSKEAGRLCYWPCEICINIIMKVLFVCCHSFDAMPCGVYKICISVWCGWTSVPPGHLFLLFFLFLSMLYFYLEFSNVLDLISH